MSISLIGWKPLYRCDSGTHLPVFSLSRIRGEEFSLFLQLFYFPPQTHNFNQNSTYFNNDWKCNEASRWVCVWIIHPVIVPGVLSALLDQQIARCPSEQLRITFCGDTVIRPDSDTRMVSGQAAQVLTTLSCWYISFTFVQDCVLSLNIAVHSRATEKIRFLKDNSHFFLCRVSQLIWARCGRGSACSTTHSASFLWHHMVAEKAVAMPYGRCGPVEWAWTRCTAWPGPPEAPYFPWSNLTSCSVTTTVAWRSENKPPNPQTGLKVKRVFEQI